MRFYLSSLLVLTLGTCVRAQIANFQPATVEMKSGEVLTGFVSLENNLRLAKGIRFRLAPKESESERALSPTDVSILTFSEQQQTYESVEFKFTRPSETEPQTERRLAQLLYDGTYKLYTMDRSEDEYFDKGSVIEPRIYLIRDGEQTAVLEVLMRAAELKTRRGKSEIVYNLIEDYRGKLRYFLRDWPKAENRIKQMRYTDREMLEIIADYDRYRNPESAAKATIETKEPIMVYVRGNYGPSVRLIETSTAANGFLGGGIYGRRNVKGSNGTVLAETGLEIVAASFETSSQRNQSTQLSSMAALRLPITGLVFLSKQSRFQPRLRLGGVVQFGVLRGKDVSFLGLAGEEFNRLILDVALLGGIGADFGRFTVDGGYDAILGFQMGVGFRIR